MLTIILVVALTMAALVMLFQLHLIVKQNRYSRSILKENVGLVVQNSWLKSQGLIDLRSLRGWRVEYATLFDEHQLALNQRNNAHQMLELVLNELIESEAETDSYRGFFTHQHNHNF